MLPASLCKPMLNLILIMLSQTVAAYTRLPCDVIGDVGIINVSLSGDTLKENLMICISDHVNPKVWIPVCSGQDLEILKIIICSAIKPHHYVYDKNSESPSMEECYSLSHERYIEHYREKITCTRNQSSLQTTVSDRYNMKLYFRYINITTHITLFGMTLHFKNTTALSNKGPESEKSSINNNSTASGTTTSVQAELVHVYPPYQKIYPLFKLMINTAPELDKSSYSVVIRVNGSNIQCLEEGPIDYCCCVEAHEAFTGPGCATAAANGSSAVATNMKYCNVIIKEAIFGIIITLLALLLVCMCVFLAYLKCNYKFIRYRKLGRNAVVNYSDDTGTTTDTRYIDLNPLVVRPEEHSQGTATVISPATVTAIHMAPPPFPPPAREPGYAVLEEFPKRKATPKVTSSAAKVQYSHLSYNNT